MVVQCSNHVTERCFLMKVSNDFTEDELLMIRRCLNEVAHSGILSEQEVEIRVGFLKEELQQLLEKFRSCGW